ncbi:MAG TPA: hypothetical protein VKH81_09780 [Candidatus Angelobacter sp.]|nr:hypothetical protein [Candidatus Angelobacter sp.]
MKVFVIALLMLVPSGQAQNNHSNTNNKAHHEARDAANKSTLQELQSPDRRDSGASNQQDYKPDKKTTMYGLTPDGIAQTATAILLAVITGIYVVITGKMLGKIGAQVEIMQKQVDNAGEQIIAARNSNYAMFRQVRQMQHANEQTNRLIEQATISALAAQKSADAADLTAKRLAQIEGSRIVPTVDWPLRPSIVNLDSLEQGNIVSRTGISVSVICKNEGKITAWITEKRLGVGFFDHIPQNPDFENIEFIFHGLHEVPREDRFKTDEGRICNESNDAGSMTMIVIWGIVKYRDIFSDSRYSTFGYFVTVDRKLKRINLPIYNQST